MSLFPRDVLAPTLDDGGPRTKRRYVRKLRIPDPIQWMQLDLFGSDPAAAEAIMVRSEAAEMDIDIALAIVPGIVQAGDDIERVNEAIEALKFARFARSSGADEGETKTVLTSIGASAEDVIKQLQEVERIVGPSTTTEEAISDEEFRATMGADEDELDGIDEFGPEETVGFDESEARKAAGEEAATSSLSLLLRSLDDPRYAPPTQERELDLGMRLRSEDPQVSHDARNELVERSMRFLVWMAKQFQYTKRPLSDLISFGMVGLIQATNKFDPSISRFTTYATDWIRQSIKREVLKDGTFKTSAYLLDKESRLRKFAAAHEDPAIAERLVAEAEKIRAEIRATQAAPTSLDSTPVGDDEEPGGLHNMFASEDLGPDEVLEKRQLINRLIHEARSLRDSRAGEIFLMHIGLHEEFLGEPLPFTEITQHFDIKRERVRVLYHAAAGQICDQMEDWANGPENLPNNFRKALKG